MTSAAERGARRHETCRWSLDLQAFHITESGETPTTLPGCAWQVPADAPPVLRRIWGGDVDPARDCAVCPAYRDAADLAPQTGPVS